MIKPIGKQGPIVFLGKKYPIREFDKIVSGQTVLSRKTMETVEFEDGTYAVIGSRYEGINIKDRVIYLCDSTNNIIKTVIQSWFGGKKPTTLVIKEKQLDKLV